jgi:citrate synthase
MADKAIITIDDKNFEMPIIKGSEGDLGFNIGKLRDDSGYITYDVGYKSTGSCTSKITFLDGEEGILRHRGYSIEDLASKCSFLEVSYLLIHGELPNKEQLDNYTKTISKHTLVHEDVKLVLNAYPTGAHPMGKLMAVMSMMSSFYPDSLNPHRSEGDIQLTITRLMAKMPTLCSMIYKHSIGHPMVYPDNSLNYVENYLKMTFGHVTEPFDCDPVIMDAMNKLLILHADHEQNCSASTVRMVGSSHANLYASISAGIAALWGPLHGGANQMVLEMLEEIKADGGDCVKAMERAKDKNSGFRLMGFGHRVYKNFDPRAKIIKVACDNVLNKLGVNDPLLDIAKQLEEIALKDDYFIERKLYPNVDFYSGIIYKALGFPTQMFTVLFALGRLPGWIAQWKEMRDNNEPISRPRQIYVGEPLRSFINLSDRK